MKKNIFLILFAFIGFTYSANAQSCCSSKAKDKSSCAKKTTSATKVSSTDQAKAVLVSNAQVTEEKTEKFTVYGNCGMCERTIENSLKEVKGVSLGDWDKETDEMTVTYNSELVTLDAIKQKIADVGYDSDTHHAKEEVYNSLPGCCQYDRPTN